jgi:antitoxin component YwqK of YwqJK toxin-antitoxin module
MQYWPNGKKKIQSVWNTNPQARDLKRNFFGYVADGMAQEWDENGKLIQSSYFKNGIFAGTIPPKGEKR